jgi:hypothetical protein
MARNADCIEFGRRVKRLGFRVYIAKDGTGNYGFITDDKGERVLSFSFTGGANLGGNYGPPSRESGTGWRLERTPSQLHTAEDVTRALYAHPPRYCGNGWKNFTTAETYLQFYASSRFAEVTEQ